MDLISLKEKLRYVSIHDDVIGTSLMEEIDEKSCADTSNFVATYLSFEKFYCLLIRLKE